MTPIMAQALKDGGVRGEVGVADLAVKLNDPFQFVDSLVQVS